MTPEQIASAWALVNAATEGPWQARADRTVAANGVPLLRGYADRNSAFNMPFIAASRELVPQLLTDLEAERAKVARLVLGFGQLDKAASEVARYGAQTGPQWSRLTMASLSARALLASIKDNSHE